MENSQDKRIKDLVKKMDQKELAKKEKSTLSEGITRDMKDRFVKLSQYNENYHASSANPALGGVGQTVNSFITNDDQVTPTKYGFVDHKAMPSVNAGVLPREALEISIRRTLDSGAPINDIGFYDEINWNLEKMGHLPNTPLQIKEAVNQLIRYGELKDR